MEGNNQSAECVEVAMQQRVYNILIHQLMCTWGHVVESGVT